MKYLGQIIDQMGRKPDPERAETIKNMPSPDNATKLQAFLGLASCYRIYIRKMYELRAPLNERLKKGKKWLWTKQCEKAFKEKKISTIRPRISTLRPKERTDRSIRSK